MFWNDFDIVTYPNSIRAICSQPLTYVRGYDEGSILSLYHFISNLFKVAHSIAPSLDLSCIGYRWNMSNRDIEDKIADTICTVWNDIKDADETARKNNEPVPVYIAPEGRYYVPSNLRCNDFMNVDLLVQMVMDAVKEDYNNAEK